MQGGLYDGLLEIAVKQGRLAPNPYFTNVPGVRARGYKRPRDAQSAGSVSELAGPLASARLLFNPLKKEKKTKTAPTW